jgi:hypothetical protein
MTNNKHLFQFFEAINEGNLEKVLKSLKEERNLTSHKETPVRATTSHTTTKT